MSAKTGREAEIEITPAMIEAGIDALSMFSTGDNRETIAWAVFGAMASKMGMRIKGYDDPKLPGLCR